MAEPARKVYASVEEVLEAPEFRAAVERFSGALARMAAEVWRRRETERTDASDHAE